MWHIKAAIVWWYIHTHTHQFTLGGLGDICRGMFLVWSFGTHIYATGHGRITTTFINFMATQPHQMFFFFFCFVDFLGFFVVVYMKSRRCLVVSPEARAWKLSCNYLIACESIIENNSSRFTTVLCWALRKKKVFLCRTLGCRHFENTGFLKKIFLGSFSLWTWI